MLAQLWRAKQAPPIPTLRPAAPSHDAAMQGERRRPQARITGLRSPDSVKPRPDSATLGGTSSPRSISRMKCFCTWLLNCLRNYCWLSMQRPPRPAPAHWLALQCVQPPTPIPILTRPSQQSPSPTPALVPSAHLWSRVRTCAAPLCQSRPYSSRASRNRRSSSASHFCGCLVPCRPAQQRGAGSGPGVKTRAVH